MTTNDPSPSEDSPPTRRRRRYTGRGRGWRKKDLTGKRYGSLVVIEDADLRIGEHVVWVCRCDCGVSVEVCANNLESGNTRSCGCLQYVREPSDKEKSE